MYTTESQQGFFFMHKSRLSCSGSTAGWKHRCLDYVQAVQHGPQCICRCDRLCTWRKRIHCIFAPDALAPFAIVRGAQTYHESLKDVCPQEGDLEHWSTRICTQSTYNDRLLHSDNHRLLQWSPTRVLRRVASYPWDSSQATHAQLTKHGIIRLFAHGILFTQRQEE